MEMITGAIIGLIIGLILAVKAYQVATSPKRLPWRSVVCSGVAGALLSFCVTLLVGALLDSPESPWYTPGFITRVSEETKEVDAVTVGFDAPFSFYPKKIPFWYVPSAGTLVTPPVRRSLGITKEQTVDPSRDNLVLEIKYQTQQSFGADFLLIGYPLGWFPPETHEYAVHCKIIRPPEPAAT